MAARFTEESHDNFDIYLPLYSPGTLDLAMVARSKLRERAACPTILDVSRLRIFILVLIAVLLPVRGAVAASMLCPQGVGTNEAAFVAEHGHHDVHSERGMHAGVSAVHHDASAEATNNDSSSGEHPTTCHFCAGGCCMACIVNTFSSTGQSELNSSVSFPALTAPAASFQSGGQDRPPRTI